MDFSFEKMLTSVLQQAADTTARNYTLARLNNDSDLAELAERKPVPSD